MRINELFEPNKFAKLTWVNNTKAVVEIAPGKDLRILFGKESDTTSIEFNVNSEYNITGGGDVAVIFATVIEAIKEFVTIDPTEDSLYFTAHEKSRARMYDRLAKRVAGQMGWHVVPYDEMMADDKYAYARKSNEFIFAIEKGKAPEHRQSAQQPQKGEFNTIYYVYSVEFPELPAIKIQAKEGYKAEMWVKKNVPEYKDADIMGIFSSKVPPSMPARTIIDKGIMPEQSKPIPQDPNSLGARLRAKLDTPK
jgi:hypothetical protein